jgi:molybdate transport system regulatory protein
MAKLSLRVDLEPSGRVGPGKVALLEQIGALGSIAAAGRSMGMSYRRAWELVEELNRCFSDPLVETRIGGNTRGGATLTALGFEVVKRFRAIENKATKAAAAELAALQVKLASNGDASSLRAGARAQLRRRPVEKMDP